MEKSDIIQFEDLNLSQTVLKAVGDLGFEEPTPIQKMAIPPALEGRDLIGQAQTGTGKTASFGIPVIEREPAGRSPYALIVEPTRELAMQVTAELQSLAKYRRRSILTVYGGSSMERQVRELRAGTNIVIGTPGRIIDHVTRRTMDLSRVAVVVLDEADEMLDMGFLPDIEKILELTPPTRQTLLFSATMPPEIVKIAKRHLRDPLRISVNVKDIVAPKISQVFYEVRQQDKPEVLARLLDVESPERTLVFCHTKREVDEVAARLAQLGYDAGALHGDFTQSHREDVMSRFRKGRIDILVATDVAGRGIDIENISHVINYSIPQDPEGYIHRIGRTGRAGRAGIAVTFVTPREYRQLQLIERIARTKLSRREIPTASEVKKARQRIIREDLSRALDEGRHRTYLGLVQEMAAAGDPHHIAAAALAIAFGSGEVSELERSRQPAGKQGMTRLFLTVGQKDRVQTAELLKTIAAEAGIPGRSVGRIDIRENFSFVEVHADIADQVVTALNRVVIRGRRLAAKKATSFSESRSDKQKKDRTSRYHRKDARLR